jgi:hypothetical protein
MLRHFIMAGAAALVVSGCGGSESSSASPLEQDYCRSSSTPNSSRVVIATCDARSDGWIDEVLSGGCDPGHVNGEPVGDFALVATEQHDGDPSGWMCAWTAKNGTDGTLAVVENATASVCCRRAQ